MIRFLTLSLLFSLILNIYLTFFRADSFQSIEECANSQLAETPSSPGITNENEVDISAEQSEIDNFEKSIEENEQYIDDLRSVLPSHFEGDILSFMMNTSIKDLEKIIHLLEAYHGVTERSVNAEQELREYFSNNIDKFKLLDYNVYCSGSGCYIKYSAPSNSDISSDIFFSSAYSSKNGAFGTQFKRDDGTVDYIDFFFFNTDK